MPSFVSECEHWGLIAPMSDSRSGGAGSTGLVPIEPCDQSDLSATLAPTIASEGDCTPIIEERDVGVRSTRAGGWWVLGWSIENDITILLTQMNTSKILCWLKILYNPEIQNNSKLLKIWIIRKVVKYITSMDHHVHTPIVCIVHTIHVHIWDKYSAVFNEGISCNNLLFYHHHLQ